jgi:hypothetical protein
VFAAGHGMIPEMQKVMLCQKMQNILMIISRDSLLFDILCISFPNDHGACWFAMAVS